MISLILGAFATLDLTQFDTLKSATVGSEILTYREINPAGKKTYIFLHATACSSLMLNTGNLLTNLAPLLADYRVLALDLRGNGGSTYNTPVKDFYDFALDVKLFLDGLGLKKVIMMGTCLGGLVSQIFAARYPTYLQGLILDGALGLEGGFDLFSDLTKVKNYPWTMDDVKTTAFYKALNDAVTANDAGKKMAGVFGYYQPSQVQAQGWPSLLADMIKTKNLDQVLFGELTTNINDGTNAVGIKGSGEILNLTGPVLIIHAKGDKFIPYANADKLAQILGSKCTYVLLPDNVGHFTWYDDMPNTIAPIKTFLEAHGNFESSSAFLTAFGLIASLLMILFA